MPQTTRSSISPEILQTVASKQGRSYILSIAIDKYQNLRPLNNAVRDARDITRLLVDKYQFDETNVAYLIDEQATQQNIFQALGALVKTVQPEDVVLIYFSGHGILQNDINEGYWIPVDGKQDNPGSFIANSMIVNYIRNIKSLHTFIIADACFSGAMFMGLGTRDFAERQDNIPSRWLMTSGRDTPVLDGEAGKNSPFADSLLLHLKNNNKEILPVTNLFRSVIEDVGNNYDQLPRCEPLQNVGHRGGEFALRLKGSEDDDDEQVQVKNGGGERKFQQIITKPAPLPAYPRVRTLFMVLIVSAVLSLGGIWGYNRFAGSENEVEERTTISAETQSLSLGSIQAGEKKIFDIVIVNEGNSPARVNDIRSLCNYIRLLDTTEVLIPSRGRHSFRAEFIAEAPVGPKRCNVRIGGGNVIAKANVDVEADVVKAPDPEPKPGGDSQKQQGDNGGDGTKTVAKAKLVTERLEIDLGTLKLGDRKSFSFTVKNSGNAPCALNPIPLPCNQISVTLKTGLKTMHPNKSNTYSGIWRADKSGTQTCTIAISGSNLDAPLRIQVKANVQSAPPPVERTCKVTCRARGRIGENITLVDGDTHAQYNAVTNAAGEASFTVPCSLLGKTAKVNVKSASGVTDRFNIVVDDFITLPDN